MSSPPTSCDACGADDPNEILLMSNKYFCGACGKHLAGGSSINPSRDEFSKPADEPSHEQNDHSEHHIHHDLNEESKYDEPQKQTNNQTIIPTSTPTKPAQSNGQTINPIPNIMNQTPNSIASNNQSGITSPDRTQSQSVHQTPATPQSAAILSNPNSTVKPDRHQHEHHETQQPSQSPQQSPIQQSINQSNQFSNPHQSPVKSAAQSEPAFVVSKLPSSSPTHRGNRRSSANSSQNGSMSEQIISQTQVAAIRAEMQAQFDAEQAILNMERDDIQQQLDESLQERAEMQAAYDQLALDYQTLVEESVARKNDFVANTGILEAELAKVTEDFERVSGEREAVDQLLEETHRVAEERAHQINELHEALQKMSAEAEEWKQKHNTLRDNATNKLKASAQEYMAIRQREQEKDIYLAEIVRELAAAQEKQTHTAARLKETEELNERLSATCATLEGDLKQVSHDLVQKNTALASTNTAASEWKGKADELAAVVERYKQNLLEQREIVRRYEKERHGMSATTQSLINLEEELRAVKEENRNLKTQLFDATAVEKSLKLALDGQGGDSDALMQVAALQAELERKEAENAELLSMVDTLIQQVEQKEQQAMQ